MVFSSIIFLFGYLAAVLAVYGLLPRRARNAFLLAVSLLFYAWGEPRYVAILLFSTVFDYCNGLALERLGAKNNRRGCRAVLLLSLVGNLGILAFFKYTNFALGGLNALLGSRLGLLELALPIGISFYTFQTLSYTIDVYRGRVAAQHSLVNFGMYVSMFPQLIAGPIVRYADIAAEIDARRQTPLRFANGVIRFCTGLGKKVLLANTIGALWSEISALEALPAATAWLGALAYTFQIYFDFSGYSDMAIGLGQMFGFTFPENFRHPYEAASITDFWRRWHITLSTWFREYLYIPLGGNRKGAARQLLNLLIVWALTGLWHGAGWNFLLWGLYYFGWLALEKRFLLRRMERWPGLLRHAYALAVVVFGWVIFACDTPALLARVLPALFGLSGGAVNGMSLYYLGSYGATFALLALASTTLPRRAAAALAERLRLAPAARLALRGLWAFGLLALSTAFLIGDSYNPFLYFRF